MTRLSVNINKIATLRNARGGNVPDVQKAACDIQSFGAEGITVHPRPDQRHIRYDDVRRLRPLVTTEFNIEGNPTPEFIDLVLEVVPDQVTLVPDAPDALTSNAGWNTWKEKDYLRGICRRFRDAGIRTSLFIDPDPFLAEAAAECGADRVELFTADYAHEYKLDPDIAIVRYYEAARAARSCGLGVNAGHDLSLENLNYYVRTIPWTAEVSIGHALISDALYLGLQPTIQAYLGEIRKK